MHAGKGRGHASPAAAEMAAGHHRRRRRRGGEEALAEHVARHPEDVGRTVEDFNWTLWTIVRPAA